MTGLELNNVRRVLCLGAHSDDIEIGCGGTVLRLLAARPDVSVRWVVFSADARRDAEARNSAAAFLQGAREKDVVVKNFRDGFFPQQGEPMKEFFETLKKDFAPDLVLTHYRDDLHQDHRVVSNLTWNTFRDHLIWEYEIPKWDGDLGRPNFYVRLEEEVVRRKVALLTEHFPSQTAKHWFTDETFRSILRLRGVESNCRYAEGFFARKVAV